MVLMFFNMFVACHSMGVPWAMIIKAVNNTEKQPKLKYLRPEDNRLPEDNRPHWSADGETTPPTPNTQLRNKRNLLSVGGAAITAGKAIAKGVIKDFVYKLSEPILKSMISSKEDNLMESWTNTLLSNTMIASSPTQMNIRYHLKNNDGQSVLTTLQNNKAKYNPPSIKPGDSGSRLELACMKNIPYVDDLLKERVGSSAMVTNTLVNAFFEDIKKTIKAGFVEAAIEFEKSDTKSSDILKTVTDILASMDTYEKIAIFCFLASVLIVNFIVLYSIWRNQRAIVALFDLQANRINEIQMQNESRAPNPSSIYPTPIYPTSQA